MRNECLDMNDVYCILKGQVLEELIINNNSKIITDVLEEVIPFSSLGTIIVTDIKLMLTENEIELNAENITELYLENENSKNKIVIWTRYNELITIEYPAYVPA
jgi:hypothetical protein